MHTVKDALGEKFAGTRVASSHALHLAAPPEAVFPLLCPVREYDWIEHWRCVMVHSESGAAEKGCTFLTDFPGRGAETWTCTVYEPDRRIEYLRVHQDRTIGLELVLEPDPGPEGRGTLLHWTARCTGLTPAGNRWLREVFLPLYPEEAALVERMLAHYLEHGQALPTGELLEGIGKRMAALATD